MSKKNQNRDFNVKNFRRLRFAQEYLVDLNATKAALRAGYSPKTAGRIGSEVLADPLVQAEIQKEIQKRQERTQITADRVLNELAVVAFANSEDYMRMLNNEVLFTDSEDLSREKMAAVAEMKNGRNGAELKMHDKVRALELLAKHLGMFEPQKKAADNEGVKVIIDV